MSRLEKILLATGLFLVYVLYMAVIVKVTNYAWLYPLVFAPLVEELVFRYAVLKITLDHLHLRQNVYVVAIITSFIFGAIHWHLNMFLFQGVLGFILSYVYIKTRSYWLIVLFHSGWNALVYFGLFKYMFN